MSSPKHESKNSFKLVSAFELFYQLTYMSAMAAAGLSRSKTFQIAALSHNPAATYFEAVNTLVDEFRYDYPEACRTIGVQSKSENMKSFLLRLSDALRSGEPLADFLAREAEIQGEDYQNKYERDLEGMKQWTNAFTSITISVALIVIIQVISAMIYSMDVKVMGGLVTVGVVISGFGAWIIYRSAPHETLTVVAAKGSKEQRMVMKLLKIVGPAAGAVAGLLMVLGLPIGWVLIVFSVPMLPVGFLAMRSDGLTAKKDTEFSTFLRSAGGMATSTGTTLKQALTKIDLTSFPTLTDDIERLSTRLLAMVDPEICWRSFGLETGSKLISEVCDIFYGAVKIGGDPERVGFICSLFTSKTSQLRAKRRLTAGTFSGLATVMQGVIAGIMVFVLSIVKNFADLVVTLMPKNTGALSSQPQMSLGMAQFSAGDLAFLTNITVVMILLLALVSAVAIVLCNGGYRVKIAFFLGLTVLISGVSFLIVPPLVAGILKV